uniref:Peptidase C14 caspase domain-containing protein n=1 Tax=Dunaliella tertiolecta TaxID=3047 RepID=A0A7S3VLC9_DUNTE|mmetsp:Transcript_27214/g.73545  ORF Transcript_27214/g.73545 Transcript_27214/m.73545 type:complete len:254 (+) Transcript_27214:64-825(+)
MSTNNRLAILFGCSEFHHEDRELETLQGIEPDCARVTEFLVANRYTVIRVNIEASGTDVLKRVREAAMELKQGKSGSFFFYAASHGEHVPGRASEDGQPKYLVMTRNGHFSMQDVARTFREPFQEGAWKDALSSVTMMTDTCDAGESMVMGAYDLQYQGLVAAVAPHEAWLFGSSVGMVADAHPQTGGYFTTATIGVLRDVITGLGQGNNAIDNQGALRAAIVERMPQVAGAQAEPWVRCDKIEGWTRSAFHV